MAFASSPQKRVSSYKGFRHLQKTFSKWDQLLLPLCCMMLQRWVLYMSTYILVYSPRFLSIGLSMRSNRLYLEDICILGHTLRFLAALLIGKRVAWLTLLLCHPHPFSLSLSLCRSPIVFHVQAFERQNAKADENIRSIQEKDKKAIAAAVTACVRYRHHSLSPSLFTHCVISWCLSSDHCVTSDGGASVSSVLLFRLFFPSSVSPLLLFISSSASR